MIRGKRFESARRLFLNRDFREKLRRKMVPNHPLWHYSHPYLSVPEMKRKASSQGIRNAVHALYKPVLELSCCDVRELNVVAKRSEERYTCADQDGSSSDG